MEKSELNLESLLAEIVQLRQDVASLKAQLASPAPAPAPTQPEVNSTRRTALKRFAAILLGGAVLTTFAGPTTLEAKVTSNPTGQNNRIGAIITPPGTSTPTGTPTSFRKIGLVATSDSSLNLSQLDGSVPIGIYGYTSDSIGVKGESTNSIGVHGFSDIGTGVAGSTYNGIGVYCFSINGKGMSSESNSGIGIQGVSSSSTGIYGTSNSGTGIYGTSTTGTGILGSSPSNIGVYGSSPGGRAVYAESDTGTGLSARSQIGTGVSILSFHGVPLHIDARPQPTAGTREVGDMYLDLNGVLHIWNGTRWTNVTTT